MVADIENVDELVQILIAIISFADSKSRVRCHSKKCSLELLSASRTFRKTSHFFEWGDVVSFQYLHK